MTVFSKVGVFNARTSTGTQIIDGLGFEPKALLFWGTGVNEDPVVDGIVYPNTRAFVGIATSGHQYCHGVGGNHNTSINSIVLRARTGAIYIPPEGGGTSDMLGHAFVDSWDNDGFTLDWQTKNEFPYQINYVAFGGDDLTDARAVAWQWPSSTGLHSITNVGFEPDLVIHTLSIFLADLDNSRSVGFATWNLGVMSSDGSQWSASTNLRQGGSPENARSISDATCIGRASNTLSAGDNLSAAFESMDSDGFTLDVLTTLADAWGLSLCLRGGEHQVGTVTQSDASGPQSVPTGGMNPLSVILASTSQPANELNQGSNADGYIAIGASDGVNNRATAVAHPRGSNAKRVHFDEAAIFIFNDAEFAPVDASASVNLEPNTFVLDWNSADSTDATIGYITFGSLDKGIEVAGIGQFPFMGFGSLPPVALVGGVAQYPFIGSGTVYPVTGLSSEISRLPLHAVGDVVRVEVLSPEITRFVFQSRGLVGQDLATYLIRMSVAGHDDWTIITTDNQEKDFTVENLTPGTYDFQVRAYDPITGEHSPWSNIVRVNTTE